MELGDPPSVTRLVAEPPGTLKLTFLLVDCVAPFQSSPKRLTEGLLGGCPGLRQGAGPGFLDTGPASPGRPGLRSVTIRNQRSCLFCTFSSPAPASFVTHLLPEGFQCDLRSAETFGFPYAHPSGRSSRFWQSHS